MKTAFDLSASVRGTKTVTYTGAGKGARGRAGHRPRRLLWAHTVNTEAESMLTNLRIKNFKAWQDTGDIALAPLTILFGTNSSGKSSLHQFLMLLRQTAESSDRRRVLHTGDPGTPVDLGSYSQLVHDGDTASALEFELGWKRRGVLELEYPREDRTFSGHELTFNATIKATEETPPRLNIQEYGYQLSEDGASQLAVRSTRVRSDDYSLEADPIDLVKTLGRKWPVSAPGHFHAFPDDVTARYQSVEFTSDLTLALEEQLSMLNYLGPLRQKPSRLYRWSGEEVGDVGWRGERTVEALLAGQGRRISRGPRKRYEGLHSVVARWLKELGVIEDFSVTPIGAGRDEYEVRVRATRNSPEVLLTDVGFGVSQVLPVVVGSFYVEPGSTLIMEQPEIHLHPAVQAGLADLFIEAVHSQENREARRTQMIIESHSEHLLRRLLRRIAEGTVDPHDVACYVVSPGRNGSRIEPLQVDEYGEVRNWPQDFFGDQSSDLIAQTRAARDRRRAARQQS